MKYKLLLLLIGILLPACYIAPVETDTQPTAVSTLQPAVEATPTIQRPSETPFPSPTQPPAATSTPEPAITPNAENCLELPGTVTNHTLPTDLSLYRWDFRVYTPPCYEVFTEKYYPSVILIHGATYSDSQWDDLGADETADELIRSGKAPPFVIIMPRDRMSVDPLEDPFGDALITRILPWVEDNYRTIPGKDYRAIGGLSRGASWAVHLGLKYPGVFSSIGAHSLAVFANDPPRLTTWLDKIKNEDIPRFYLDIGEKDLLLDNAQWFENLLTSKNIPHEWHLNPGTHDEAYWIAHVEEYLIWYTSVWMP